MQGFATEAGTSGYRRRLGTRAARGHFKTWQGLRLSSVGIGTCLGAEEEATDRVYEDAVKRALQLGINVVDTSVSNGHQRCERSIGAALRALVAEGGIAREDVVLSSRAGLLPFDGTVPANPTAYFTETYVRTGVLKAADLVGRHCLTPRYLADQIDRSRRNLGVETIDVYCIDKPEMQLGGVDRPTFMTRMRAAFEFLESAVGDGRIRWYGTATWEGYRRPATAPDHLSLPDLVELAREVAGTRHHFGVVQLPYSLAMTEALAQANQQVGKASVSVLQAAAQLGVYVMTSAPISQGKLARNLPPALSQVLEGLRTDAQRALQFVRSTPGVGTALCGMKQVAHVEENAALVGLPPAPVEKLFTRG